MFTIFSHFDSFSHVQIWTIFCHKKIKNLSLTIIAVIAATMAPAVSSSGAIRPSRTGGTGMAAAAAARAGPSMIQKKTASNNATATATATTTTTTTAITAKTKTASTKSSTVDPNALLDALDTYTAAKMPTPTPVPTLSGRSSDNNTVQPETVQFDAIHFLNGHYTMESQLVASLPLVRTTIAERIGLLDETISTAIQRQADLADSTALDVKRAKAAVLQLHERIQLVQNKAQLSEQAVIEITRDMKRLDYAKRHLQKTITALKRLHMLVHAVEQLRIAALQKPHPDYRGAANLVDATRLLLSHFDGYVHKVSKMRQLTEKVDAICKELQVGVLRGFRVVGFAESSDTPAQMEGIISTTNTNSMDTGSADGNAASSFDNTAQLATPTTPPMPREVLSMATFFIDALGMRARREFIHVFCTEHLAEYNTLFMPPSSASSSGGGPSGALATASKPSFKISLSSASSSTYSAITASGEKKVYSLDQSERRYAWYRGMHRSIMDEKFLNVFPRYWNMHYELTRLFLQQTREHFLALLDGSTKDKDSENVTILLKALQKSILFEKEMMAWLQRDYGTKIIDATTAATPVLGDGGEELEFDESGRAVAADSAQGIRIRYERKMKKQSDRAKDDDNSYVDREAGLPNGETDGRATEEVIPVKPLGGVASCAFDNYMNPYISLEEQNMDEQLVISTSDSAVDTRGELPVFISSTGLFVYIRNSITRCTVLTKGRTFFLLYQAFQDTLRKYATVLGGKFPAPLTTTAVGGISIPVSSFGPKQADITSSSSYRIPPGEEVTVCHVIDTCEYCADTVEALEDMIRETIDEEFKNRIDMSGEQEAFHDITARGIRVLVSGLENRTEAAMKDMNNMNWATIEMVGEESDYVRTLHQAIQPFVEKVKGLIPTSYFRSFCDRFAAAFTKSYYESLIRQKRISESGTQQLLLDVYNIKTLLLKLPVIETKAAVGNSVPSMMMQSRPVGSTIAPAIYTKMVTKQFARIEILLKLVGTPTELLIDVFKAQWSGGSALDLQTVMNLKGMKRQEQTTMLEKFGVDPDTAMRGAAAGASGTSMTEHVQALQGKGSDVAAKVNSDLSQMRRKVDDFRRAFR